MRPRRVRAHHPTDGAELPARWIYRKSQADTARPAIDLATEDAGRCSNRALLPIGIAHVAQATEIHDHTSANGAGGHATARSAGHEGLAVFVRPARENRCVFTIDRNRDC